jgi:DNA replication protein DnaC
MTCEVCGGTRFVVPATGGRAVPCPVCTQEKSEGKRGGGDGDKSFRSFIPDNPQMEYALGVAENYAQNPRGILVMRGATGVGKTHLAHAIINTAGLSDVIAGIAPDLLDAAREASYGERTGGAGSIEHLCRCALLLIDDLGTERKTEWAEEAIITILDHRHRHDLATIVTMNDEAFYDLPLRVQSRLTAKRGLHVVMHGMDKRSGLGGRSGERLWLYPHRRLSNFDTTLHGGRYAENLTKVKEACERFVENQKQTNPRLMFLVITSQNFFSGKTHLGAGIAHETGAMFMYAPDMMSYWLESFDSKNKAKFSQRYDEARGAKTLVVDGFGDHGDTTWQNNTMERLLLDRYEYGRSTVILVQPNKIDRLPKALSSRLALEPHKVLEITAAPYRPHNKRGEK